MSYIQLHNLNEDTNNGARPITLNEMRSLLMNFATKDDLKESLKEFPTRKEVEGMINESIAITRNSFNDVYERFNEIDIKFDKIDVRFDMLTSTMNYRFDGVNRRIDEIATNYARRDEVKKLASSTA